MKKNCLFALLSAIIFVGVYWFIILTFDPIRETVSIEEGFYFDFVYNPPQGWDLWEGVSASMSTFATGDKGYDPYDEKVMQEYMNQWSPTKTEVLVFVRSGTVAASVRDYESVIQSANTHADDPLYYDDVRMVLYNKAIDVSIEGSVSDIHVRAIRDVAGVTGDYFRMTNPPGHDSVNLSIPYKEKTITFYKNVPKEMSDEEVINLLSSFVEKIPF